MVIIPYNKNKKTGVNMSTNNWGILDPYARSVVTEILTTAFADAAQSVKSTYQTDSLDPYMVQEMVRAEALGSLLGYAAFFEEEGKSKGAGLVALTLRNIALHPLPDFGAAPKAKAVIKNIKAMSPGS